MSADTQDKIRVWDPFVRIFHWLVAGAFFLDYFEATRAGGLVHQILGYIILGLVAARLGWGFIGTRHARFTDFVRGPQTVLTYLRSLLKGQEERHLGHNPAAGVMIVTLLILVCLIGLTGWLQTTDAYYGVKWVEEAHEILANVTFMLVCVHIAAAVFESLRHRENLILAMITGEKRR